MHMYIILTTDQNASCTQLLIVINRLFYHGVGEISDLSQSEAPNLVM